EITTDYNHVYAIVNPSKKFSIGASDGNVSAWNSSDPDAVGDLTYVVQYTPEQMKVFRDGLLVLTKTGNAASILSAIQFFATNKYISGRNQFNGLLKNIAIYKKTMTDDELKKLSQSFKW
ncbi:LamG-like jellyroll fold domain-containing protein, partial [Acinetobacter baumannii]|nr:LamG-like jellyroll fold domain-containing protein [Acinetobacter baumannii]